MTAPIIRARDLSVRFPGREVSVLEGISLDVASGDEVVVLGPSGSGKSTLLGAVTGAVPHHVPAEVTGSVQIDGVAGGAVAERARVLGAVAQDPSSAVCLPTVDEELTLPLENRAVPPGEMEGRIRTALVDAGAGHLRGRATSALSGGEAQRVALAAALAADPSALLLDEPTAMLDPAGVAAVRAAVQRAARDRGRAAVLVEHRLDEWAGDGGSAGLPARAIALGADGRIVADGPTDRVLREHGPALRDAGCWLPLDAELFAATGAAGGLGAAPNLALLDALARRASPADDVARGGSVVLAARGLAVGRAPARRRRRDPAPTRTLAGLDVAFRAGEITAILGPNGIGKTTLLMTLAGLLPPLAGAVAGQRPGMVFQNAEHQFVGRTVRDEIAHGLASAARHRVVKDALARHRLAHLADRSPFRLSGGEKRRLSAAAMLAHDRPALLADEPTLGLDRRDAIALVRTLRAAAVHGTAIVFASHDLRTVAALATRVVLLAEGGVIADGPAERVLADPAALRRAGVAAPPLVRAALARVPGRLRAVLDGLDVLVDDRAPAEVVA